MRLDFHGVVAQAPAHHVLTWSPRQVVLQSWEDRALSPVGEGVHTCRDACELGDEGIAHPDGHGEVPYQRFKERLARASSRAFDNRSEGNDLIVKRR